MTGARGHAEIEVKLALDPALADALPAHPAVGALRRGPTRVARLRTIYHDTADRRLAREGIALRSRRTGRRWTIAVKGAPGAAGTLASRPEIEWPSATAAPDPLRLSATPWRVVFARALARGSLAPVFETDVERTTIPVAFDDGTTATIDIDRGWIVASAGSPPRARAAVCEVEIELGRGDPSRLLDLAGLFADELGCALEPRSKAERGYALADGRTPVPVKAREVDLAAGAGARAAAVAMLSECIRQIEGNAVGFPAPADPEWIHQIRIGVRRLRSLLALSGDLFAQGRVDHLKHETRWLLDALGPARDLDVYALQTLPLALDDPSFAPADRAGAPWDRRAYSRRVAVRRRATHSDADAAIGSPRFVRFVLSAIAMTIAADDDRRRPEDGDTSARAYARRRLERRARRLDEAGARLVHATDDQRHAVRIAAKKLRYATEFYAPLFPRRRARAFRERLERLQDVLGEFNDAAVAPRVTASIAGPASPVTAAIDAWSRARCARLADPIDAAWRRYASGRPFWDRD